MSGVGNGRWSRYEIAFWLLPVTGVFRVADAFARSAARS